MGKGVWGGGVEAVSAGMLRGRIMSRQQPAGILYHCSANVYAVGSNTVALIYCCQFSSSYCSSSSINTTTTNSSRCNGVCSSCSYW